jgi:hypothetical protein
MTDWPPVIAADPRAAAFRRGLARSIEDLRSGRFTPRVTRRYEAAIKPAGPQQLDLFAPKPRAKPPAKPR